MNKTALLKGFLLGIMASALGAFIFITLFSPIIL
jgi:hypothetical protein